MTTQTFTVSGMTCEHCAQAVTSEVGGVQGVEAVVVDLPQGVVTVSSAGGVDPAAVAAAVDEAGYEVVP